MTTDLYCFPSHLDRAFITALSPINSDRLDEFYFPGSWSCKDPLRVQGCRYNRIYINGIAVSNVEGGGSSHCNIMCNELTST